MAADTQEPRLDTRELTRKLIRWSAVGMGAVVCAAVLGAFAIHTIGAYRLEAARADFTARWGDLTQVEPIPVVPDDENGARWLVAGGRAIVCTAEDRRFYGQLSERTAASWTDAERSRARWILHEQQNALKILLRSGSLSDFYLAADGDRATYDHIDFTSIVMGLRLLALEARLAWIEGRTSDGLAAVNAIGRSADGLLRTPVVMTSTIGSAATRWAVLTTADFVGDPCTDITTLEGLLATLPREDPIQCSSITLAVLIAEIAGEGLQYTDDLHDPSMSWSIPFWVSSPYLFENLVVSEIVDRWDRYLQLSRQPAAHWPSDVGRSIWSDSSWPPWLALGGTVTPNLLSATARAQAASAQIMQVRLAIDVRLASLRRLATNGCESFTETAPTPLTGEPVACRYDESTGFMVVEIPGADEALEQHVSKKKLASQLPPIEVPMSDAGCGDQRTKTMDNHGQ